MSNVSPNDPVSDIAPGDIVVIDRGAGDRPYKVVHKEPSDAGFLITFSEDDTETFQLDLPADKRVARSLESKWESEQSPTPHTEAGPHDS
ncbi:hypothetical protein Mycch_5146 [Mycolicibacterium chubuense NBB4]|uniref:Uncharacterized protein n=1 Tax=Mycolicibacterium chubuense (strain NBB4) TaxID=710421 RepID=I4BRC5_MYCCN|nr:hypothetical protein [Mycolicibacterium chubuense]AFM19832.1 hypothetical protein Mycch_5146 [Mycolicibacterium chubuense NBB4]